MFRLRRAHGTCGVTGRAGSNPHPIPQSSYNRDYTNTKIKVFRDFPAAAHNMRTFPLEKNELLTMEATMNKKTKALTTEQYKEIIQTMREGFQRLPAPMSA